MTEHTLGPARRLGKEHRTIERAMWLLSSVRRNGEGGALTKNQATQVDRGTSVIGASLPRMLAAEEGVVFPALRRSAPSLSGTLDGLLEEHQQIHRLVGEVAPTFRQWLKDGVLPDDRNRALEKALVDLQTLLFAHLQSKERQVFPQIDRAMEPDATEILLRWLDGTPPQELA